MSALFDEVTIITSFLNHSDYASVRLVNSTWKQAADTGSKYHARIRFGVLNTRKQSGVLRKLALAGDVKAIQFVAKIARKGAAANALRNLISASRFEAAQVIIKLFGESVFDSPALGKISNVLLKCGANTMLVAMSATALLRANHGYVIDEETTWIPTQIIENLLEQFSGIDLVCAAAISGHADFVDQVVDCCDLTSDPARWKLYELSMDARGTLKRSSAATYFSHTMNLRLPRSKGTDSRE